MTEVLESIRHEALPFFDRAGTVDGILDIFQRSSEESPLDTNYLELLCYLHAIRGDVAETIQMADRVLTSPLELEQGLSNPTLLRVRKVSQLVASNPEDARSLMRGWANETWEKISKK